MSLAARVKRLEMRCRSILRCLRCQYWASMGVHELELGSTDPDVVNKCDTCGARYGLSLQKFDAHEREVLVMMVEADPIGKLHDERFYAAINWMRMRHSEIGTYQKAMTRQDKPRFCLSYPPPPFSDEQGGIAVLSTTEKKKKREQDDLKKRAAHFTRRERDRIKRLTNAPETFPVDETV